MEKTNSYYGFTDKCTPMQKAKKEAQLDKLFKNGGEIMRFADFAICMTFEKGYKGTTEIITHGMINGYFGKEYGKLSKPKTEYCFGNTEDGFYIINKTLFDYCNYIANTFNSFEEAETYAKAEAERKAEQEKLAEKARIEAEKAEQEKEQQKIAFDNWLFSECKKYIGTNEEKLCKKIFTHYYGETAAKPISVVGVVVLARNIKNPMCRQELVERLHNGNKASIKVFECFTGIELPKTYKERIKVLSDIQPEQYKGMAEFKPRAKND